MQNSSTKATTQSIEDLENVVWPDPVLQSHVAVAGAALRKKPIKRLNSAEVMLGLGQHIGVHCLVPVAISLLQQDPMLEANFYEGDLLQTLLDIPAEFWTSHPSARLLVEELYGRALTTTVAADEDWRADFLADLKESYERFAGRLPSRPWIRGDQGRVPPPQGDIE